MVLSEEGKQLIKYETFENTYGELMKELMADCDVHIIENSAEYKMYFLNTNDICYFTDYYYDEIDVKETIVSLVKRVTGYDLEILIDDKGYITGESIAATLEQLEIGEIDLSLILSRFIEVSKTLVEESISKAEETHNMIQKCKFSYLTNTFEIIIPQLGGLK